MTGGRLSCNLSELTAHTHILLTSCNTSTSKMSSDKTTDPPPYLIPVEVQGSGVKVYHVHTPFTPPTSEEAAATQVTPVYTSGGGGLGTGADSADGKRKFVSYDVGLGSNPGMTTCPNCQQQVMTNVTYKAGTYAWLMCLLFICLGLVLCCCLIPFFMKRFKDAHHTCPKCRRVLHVEKKQCCK